MSALPEQKPNEPWASYGTRIHQALAAREALQVRLAELGIDCVLDMCPTGIVIGLETQAAEQLLAALATPGPKEK